MKKKALIHLLSGFIPMIIFFICSQILGFVPIGNKIMNIYDSFTQYPGFLLEYARMLKSGHLFYSFSAGLGFNFYGTITYYCFSALNLFSVFATPKNYPYFIAYMTFLRFILLGMSMCFYLRSLKIDNKLVILFSTIYALMGYTATYYYNYIWIDTIIMLPLVIYGLDKLINENKSFIYILTLTITIFINFYTGYMVCIFVLIYFVYKFILSKNKKKILINFIISSLLVGLISTVVILPSYYALKLGKATLYEKITYDGLINSYKEFFYMMTTGNYKSGDQGYGPPQVYASLLVLSLVPMFFFNKKYTLKEKIVTLVVIIIFLASFSVKALNYAWQFFQQPIWWQSRFSFTFDFFIIVLAARTFNDRDHLNVNVIKKSLVFLILTTLILFGAYTKYKGQNNVTSYYIYLALSIIILCENIFFIDQKEFYKLMIILTFVDLGTNTYNSLGNNSTYKNLNETKEMREVASKEISNIIKNDSDEFYRMEFINHYGSDDGPYFGYNGLNYFNSARNLGVVHLFEALGFISIDHCHVELDEIDPVILSILNVKYIYGKMDYYKKTNEAHIYENPYPLALGYTVSDDIKDFKFPLTETKGTNYTMNISSLINALTHDNVDLYEEFDYTNFKLTNLYPDLTNNLRRANGKVEGRATYDFISDKHYLIITPNTSSIVTYISINNKKAKVVNDTYTEIKPGDKVKIDMTVNQDVSKSEFNFLLLNLDNYENTMDILGQDLFHAHKYRNGHLIEGTIDVNSDNTYLFTTIEYEKGMRIFVDDKEVKPDILLDSLIGLDLEKGSHKIYISYVPNGFIKGLIISFVGIILSFIYLQTRKKKL